MALPPPCYPRCLVARKLDSNSHGGGFITKGQSKVFNANRFIAQKGNTASPDSRCDDNRHCNPRPRGVSGSRVFIHGCRIHRITDDRRCGAVTEPQGPDRKVYLSWIRFEDIPTAERTACPQGPLQGFRSTER